MNDNNTHFLIDQPKAVAQLVHEYTKSVIPVFKSMNWLQRIMIKLCFGLRYEKLKYGNKILDAIKKMAADDNKGLRMSTTIVDVKDDPRGSIVGFGTEKDCGDDAKAQTIGLPGKYMACAFFIDREELKKYL